MINSLPPFYVGQEVVCIKGHSLGLVKKGSKYTIKAVDKGCSCSPFIIKVDIPDYPIGSTCYECGLLNKPDTWLAAGRFAPIESTFQPITYTRVLEVEAELINGN